MPAPPALALDGVTVRYGSRVALDGLTLAVAPGEVFGLLGPNGSGKSTALAVAAGLTVPDAGEARAAGRGRRADPQGYARAVGYAPQVPAIYDELSAEENLRLFARLHGLSGPEARRRAAEALSAVGMSAHARRPCAELSGGMRARVNVACALAHGPAALLLDEPTAALDAEARRQVGEVLRSLAAAGTAVLLTTHSLEEAACWCDRVGELAAGRLARCGRPDRGHGPPGHRPQLPPDTHPARSEVCDAA